MSNLLEKAILYAAEKHAGRKRKGTNRLYIQHPLTTMQILASMHADENLLAAGVLHDTVEDTEATIEEIRDLAADYAEVGEALWERFNAPPEKQSWYYSEVQDALHDMQDDPDTETVYWEMVALYKDVFVTFYCDREGTTILYKSRHDEDYIIRRDKDTKADEDTDWFRIPREEAERIEDEWRIVRIQENDLRDEKYELLCIPAQKTVHITISNGKATLEGWTHGEEDEEYSYLLNRRNTEKLMCELRILCGLHCSTDAMLAAAFAGEDAGSLFAKFCRKRGIEYLTYFY